LPNSSAVTAPVKLPANDRITTQNRIRSMTRSKSHFRLLTSVLLFAAAAQTAMAADRFSFVALGDVPYREAHFPHFERLIAHINAFGPVFSIHVGDIKSGVSFCDDAVYERMRGLFDRFDSPLVYTPGDNEWTDCHRIGPSDRPPYDPVERLQHLRSVFFPGTDSLGRNPMPLQRQSAEPRHARFVENARWERAGVHFTTVHVVGSNNNLQRGQAAVNEYVERNAANLAWINAAFDRAESAQAKAVVLALHADLRWELDGSEDQRAGFTDTIRLIKERVLRFGRPVLLVHGDRHRLLIDKPMQLNRQLIYNATRLMVPGDRTVQAVIVTVDPEDPDVFSFRTLTVTGNVESPQLPAR
jgi:hypothetical protein